MEIRKNINGEDFVIIEDIIYDMKNALSETHVSDDEETFDKDFETISITESNVEYPILNTTKIKMFDLEKMVKEIKSQQLGKMSFANTDLGEPFKVDDLIKSIDDKIEQLEIEEKMNKLKKDDKEKAEFDQFKIEDK